MNDLFEYLKTLDDTPYEEHLRQITEHIVQHLIEIDLNQTIDAIPYERNEARMTYRNGYRERQWQTEFGQVRLKIPKLRNGTYYPHFIKNPDFHTSLMEFVQQVYLFGVSETTDYPSIHAQINDVLRPFLHAPIPDHYESVWLHVYHQQALFTVIAVGMDAENAPHMLGFDHTRSLDDEDFWQAFLERLARRGLQQVKLIISGAYRGIKRAVYEAFPNAEWHYSQVDCLEDLKALLNSQEQTDVLDAVARVYAAPDYESARERLERLIKTLKPRQPQAALLLEFHTEAILNFWKSPPLAVGKISLPEQPQMAVSILDEQFQPRSVRVC